jgi:hypothetical protein
MDVATLEEEPVSTLSYDDTTPYEEQIAASEPSGGLADRIGTTRVYLLSESSSSGRLGKVRR